MNRAGCGSVVVAEEREMLQWGTRRVWGVMNTFIVLVVAMAV